jgi:rubrerythrin
MANRAKSALQALEDAKCLEQEGQAFYRKAAAKTKSEKGKKLFLSLAEDETMHERLIQRQIDHWKAEREWKKLPEAEEGLKCDLNESIFPPAMKGLEEMQADANDVDAILAALEFETKGYDLYRREAKAATDPAAREMYEFLASQERLHFDLLMTNYEAMFSYGGWAD